MRTKSWSISTFEKSKKKLPLFLDFNVQPPPIWTNYNQDILGILKVISMIENVASKDMNII